MPYNDPDMTDPMTLHGVMVETESIDAHREMAECFIDEYLRLGFDRQRLLQLFRIQGYAGPHLAYQILGEEAIVSLIDEQIARWGPRHGRDVVDTRPNGNISLSVLN